MADKRAAGGRARCMRSSMLAMSSSRARLTPGEFSGLARRRLRLASWRASSSLSAQYPAAPEGAGRPVRP
eukprot:6866352-Prorocentrum_lima.AAC.1